MQRRSRDSSIRAEEQSRRETSSAVPERAMATLEEEFSNAARTRPSEVESDMSQGTIEVNVLRTDEHQEERFWGRPAPRSRSHSNLRYSIKMEEKEDISPQHTAEDDDEEEGEQEELEDDRRSVPPLALSSHRFAHLYDDPIEKPELPQEYKLLQAVEDKRRAKELRGESAAGKVWSYLGGLLNHRLNPNSKSDSCEKSMGRQSDESEGDGDDSFASSNSSTTTEEYLRPSTRLNSPESPSTRILATVVSARHPKFNGAPSRAPVPSVSELIKTRESLIPPPAPLSSFVLPRDGRNQFTKRAASVEDMRKVVH